jgi:putative membrane protein
LAPTESNKAQKAAYDKLSKLSANAFDRQFAKMMVDDHKKDIREFEKDSKISNQQVAGRGRVGVPRASLWGRCTVLSEVAGT